MSYTLSREAQFAIEKKTGIKFEEILRLNAKELDERVEKRIGKKLSIQPIRDERLAGRGSVFIFLERFLTFNTKKLDRYIDKIK